MNAVVIAVIIMLILSLLRVNVVLSLIIGAITGGLVGGLGVTETIEAFSSGIGKGANIALSYALLGAFAIAISHTGLPKWLVNVILKAVQTKGETKSQAMPKVLIVFVIFVISCFSQNLIPIHIAFIPLLIPPLIYILNELRIDRRLIACVLTFGLTAPYILLPIGFGQLFHQILAENMTDSGLTFNPADISKSLLIPVVGMFIGLLFAVFVSYRKPRIYESSSIVEENMNDYSIKGIIFSCIAIIVTMYVQIETNSMIFGAVSGILILYMSGSIRLKQADSLFTEGMQMMAFIGFTMIAANGFADVLRQTGHVEELVSSSAELIGHNKSLGAVLMLLIGLLVTMGIGSSFSTIPIIATIFVPLCIQIGFSPLATISIVGTAAALGDAGSPASDSTLGPTAGLNVDSQHNHIWDSCVPTFLHFNIPLLIFGWIAALIL